MIHDRAEDAIQLCEVGDIVYRIHNGKLSYSMIIDIKKYPHCVYKTDTGGSYFNTAFGKTLFKTREEARKELVKRKHIKEKREKLKEYERKLNEELNIGDHYIVK